MTVLDEVLQAETQAAANVAEAELVAATQVADAKKVHTDTVEAEKKTLKAAEAVALTAHEQTVQTNSKRITDAAQKDVATIRDAFDTKATELHKKISDAVA